MHKVQEIRCLKCDSLNGEQGGSEVKLMPKKLSFNYGVHVKGDSIRYKCGNCYAIHNLINGKLTLNEKEMSKDVLNNFYQKATAAKMKR